LTLINLFLSFADHDCDRPDQSLSSEAALFALAPLLETMRSALAAAADCHHGEASSPGETPAWRPSAKLQQNIIATATALDRRSASLTSPTTPASLRAERRREPAFTICLPRLPARLDAPARIPEFSAVVLTRSKP